MSPYRYSYEGEDRYGVPIWSCTRGGGGICGYGPTQKEALAAFLDLEDQLVPLPRALQVFSSRYEPNEYIDEPAREEDYP